MDVQNDDWRLNAGASSHLTRRWRKTDSNSRSLREGNAIIENGFVYVPETAPWLAEYLHEMTVFPNGKHGQRG